MQRTLDPRDQRRLAGRAPLPVDPASAIAIKRDVHEFIVACDADRYADAFRRVVTDPASMFGLIRIRRAPERLGASFAIGERFQGCFSLERALLGALEQRGLSAAAERLAAVLARPSIERAITWIEDQMLSDYGEIEEIVTDPAPGEPHRLRYRYLDGTPIAGSSVFEIEPLGPDQCRVRQIFEYQEINAIAVASFQRIGLKYHDQVVYMQIHTAAELAGARVVSSTIPAAYGGLAH